MLQQRQDWETPQVKDLEHVYMRLEVNSNRFEISHHFQKLFRLHGDFTLFCYEHLLFTWKTHCGLKFHFGQIYRCEICTEVSFTLPELMWVLIMKLPYTEVKFFHEVKSQICVGSLWVSCKCALKAGHTKTLHFYTLHITHLASNSFFIVLCTFDKYIETMRSCLKKLNVSTPWHIQNILWYITSSKIFIINILQTNQ